MVRELLETFYSELEDWYQKTLERLRATEQADAAESLKSSKYSVFYSNPLQTLKESPLYFLAGLNPGGPPKAGDYSVETLADFEKKGEWSEYNEPWKQRGKEGKDGAAVLQVRITELLEFILREMGLEPDIRTVFCLNLYFFRSTDTGKLSEYKAGDMEPFYKKWHLEFLNIVKPRIIVCNGNGLGLSAYSRLKQWFQIMSDEELKLNPYPTFFFKSCFINDPPWGTQPTLVLGFPHLRRFAYSVNNPLITHEIRNLLAQIESYPKGTR